MALRIRIRKWNPHKKPIIIVCAAETVKKKNDIYVNDSLHYFLANVVKVILKIKVKLGILKHLMTNLIDDNNLSLN